MLEHVISEEAARLALASRRKGTYLLGMDNITVIFPTKGFPSLDYRTTRTKSTIH